MAKHHVETPADVQIAAMQVAERRFGNLLEAGSGTPWEDRGSIGAVFAFFKTAIMSMFRPHKLLYSLRRPETASDARIFAIICGVCWGLGWALQDYLDFLWRRSPEFDMVNDGYIWVLHFILGLAGTWFFVSVISRVFYKLISAGDMRSKFPAVLLFNVYAYCLGPSILAVIPFRVGWFQIGATIALVWIFCLIVYAAIDRLAIKPSGSIICNSLTYWGFLGLAYATYNLLYKIIAWLYAAPPPPGH
jgi:hypothetical protein